MNVWADKLDDIRVSLNDIYMVGLMSGWMFFFMGFLSKRFILAFVGLFFAILFLILVRTQLFINQTQYINGMIPHHSMAVMMSKRLANKQNNINKFINNIIRGQEEEIKFMKSIK
jgi:hypothetical protein